jgi:uncharacterized DUF497 family protein
MKEVQFGHFIWHSDKDSENIRKHGIDFRTAIEVVYRDGLVRI